MNLNKRQRNRVFEEIYRLVDGVLEGFVSERVRIIAERDIYRPLISQLRERHLSYFHRVSRNVVYELLKSTEVLEEDPDKPWQFITYKTKWREFREKQNHP